MSTPPLTKPDLPDPGEWYFWRIVQQGAAVSIELRAYRKTIGDTRRSLFCGARGPLRPNADNIARVAISLLRSRDSRIDARAAAARWAGDYPSSKGRAA